ncbi:MAG: hypothetical protein QXN15_01790, partial [Candidatus Jordarchaeales archaeon]
NNKKENGLKGKTLHRGTRKKTSPEKNISPAIRNLYLEAVYLFYLPSLNATQDAGFILGEGRSEMISR